ncbi:hypothetical protein TNCV_2264681 [Trichonephila clavipes]|nr:hypothetical protein TNCV_2264681 [Trichonephila clavipes]
METKLCLMDMCLNGISGFREKRDSAEDDERAGYPRVTSLACPPLAVTPYEASRHGTTTGSPDNKNATRVDNQVSYPQKNVLIFWRPKAPTSDVETGCRGGHGPGRHTKRGGDKHRDI